MTNHTLETFLDECDRLEMPDGTRLLIALVRELKEQRDALLQNILPGKNELRAQYAGKINKIINEGEG